MVVGWRFLCGVVGCFHLFVPVCSIVCFDVYFRVLYCVSVPKSLTRDKDCKLAMAKKCNIHCIGCM